MPNMVMDAQGGLLIGIHNASTPTEPEWQEYIARTVELIDGQPPGGRARQLILTEGGGPSLDQRRLAQAAARGRPELLVAVVSSSVFVRFIVSALTLWNPPIRVFAPGQIDQAYRFLGIADVAGVERRIDALRVALGRPESRAGKRLFKRSQRVAGERSR